MNVVLHTLQSGIEGGGNSHCVEKEAKAKLLGVAIKGR